MDPDPFDDMKDRVKQQLRRRMRALRMALPEAAVAARSARIAHRLAALDPIANAGSVALFWPILERHEVDLRDLDRTLRAAGKTLYYPFMDPLPHGGFSTGFRRVDDPVVLAERGRRFSEPPADAARAEPGQLGAIVVPALAVTEDGTRLGYGAGFYDVTLPEFRPPALAVVVAFDFQLVVELPASDHDVACDLVVTDRHVFPDPG